MARKGPAVYFPDPKARSSAAGNVPAAPMSKAYSGVLRPAIRYHGWVPRTLGVVAPGRFGSIHR